MTFNDIIQTIQEDWAILVFFFTLGGIWWQGQAWFKKIETSLVRESNDHHGQTAMLRSIHDKVENLEDRIGKIEETVVRIHEEQHEQEVKLAVLETTAGTRRKTSRL
jgi:hypothetical protein